MNLIDALSREMLDLLKKKVAWEWDSQEELESVRTSRTHPLCREKLPVRKNQAVASVVSEAMLVLEELPLEMVISLSQVVLLPSQEVVHPESNLKEMLLKLVELVVLDKEASVASETMLLLLVLVVPLLSLTLVVDLHLVLVEVEVELQVETPLIP